ncbi:unnamed protein product [Cuscuta europaea]|uniref:Uncharacterized protein n=1 Tax=Cuscuta europaea TaxID=41803 RepID=A0A9P0Z3G4_CUSEU|nr:unnamed protein product [Cuscuta europaea]
MEIWQPQCRQKLFYDDNVPTNNFWNIPARNPQQEFWNQHYHTRLLSGRRTRKGLSRMCIPFNQYHEPLIWGNTSQQPHRRIWSPELHSSSTSFQPTICKFSGHQRTKHLNTRTSSSYPFHCCTHEHSRRRIWSPELHYSSNPVQPHTTSSYPFDYWAPEHTKPRPVRRSWTHAYHPRANTHNFWYPPGRLVATKNFMRDRRYALQRPPVQPPLQHPQIEEDGWSLVKYKGRRSPHVPLLSLPTPLQKKGGTGSANRYQSLRGEDEIPCSQPSDSEVESESNFLDTQKFCVISNTITERRTKSEPKKSTVKDLGALRRRPENSSVPPLDSSLGPPAIIPTTDNLLEDNNRLTGKAKITWADLLKGSSTDNMDRRGGPDIFPNNPPFAVRLWVKKIGQ